MVNNWLKYLLFQAFPPSCVLCGAKGNGELDLCSACLADLPREEHRCRQCALPVPETGNPTPLCGACQQIAPPVDRSFSYATYAPPIDRLILQLKFNQKLENARLLGTLMAQQLSVLHTERKPQLIIPVPLHRNRLRQRGFNQALEIAHPIAAKLKIPLDVTSCRRVRATLEQSGLAAKERRRNMKNAFSVTRHLGFNHVAIVDDVMTTGNTLYELARQLKSRGVQTVEAWVGARAVR
jgi:ComF family protein